MTTEQDALEALEQRKRLAAQPIDPNIQPGDTIMIALTDYEEALLRQKTSLVKAERYRFFPIQSPAPTTFPHSNCKLCGRMVKPNVLICFACL